LSTSREYRFDAVFRADRFGTIFHYIQTGLEKGSHWAGDSAAFNYWGFPTDEDANKAMITDVLAAKERASKRLAVAMELSRTVAMKLSRSSPQPPASFDNDAASMPASRSPEADTKSSRSENTMELDGRLSILTSCSPPLPSIGEQNAAANDINAHPRPSKARYII